MKISNTLTLVLGTASKRTLPAEAISQTQKSDFPQFQMGKQTKNRFPFRHREGCFLSFPLTSDPRDRSQQDSIPRRRLQNRNPKTFQKNTPRRRRINRGEYGVVMLRNNSF